MYSKPRHSQNCRNLQGRILTLLRAIILRPFDHLLSHPARDLQSRLDVATEVSVIRLRTLDGRRAEAAKRGGARGHQRDSDSGDGGERAHLASARGVNPEAHEAYLLGRYHLRRQNEAELKLAIGHFERAIQLDASYAAAWAGLSMAWLQRRLFGATPFREVELPARQAIIKALALDAGSA